MACSWVFIEVDFGVQPLGCLDGFVEGGIE